MVAVAVLAWVIGALRPTRWQRLRARLPRAATIAAWVGLAFVAFGVLRVLPVDSLQLAAQRLTARLAQSRRRRSVRYRLLRST